MIPLNNIVEGFTNLVSKDDMVEQIATERLAICETCEFKKKIACGKCGCVLQAKTRSLSSACPILKWRVVNKCALINQKLGFSALNLNGDITPYQEVLIKKGALYTLSGYYLIRDSINNITYKTNKYDIL